MRKMVITLSTTLSLLIIVGQFNVWDSLLLFLLVGTIPGTSFSLPPIAMLICMTLFAGGVALFIAAQADSAPEVSEKTLPKKRYSRI
ncbi:MAG: hypothetical protein JWM00_672 [Candidatus Saccharibacteria bacterium]|nr:hypothetical protein [Candidatus Saccharibacteria bacterium]